MRHDAHRGTLASAPTAIALLLLLIAAILFAQAAVAAAAPQRAYELVSPAEKGGDEVLAESLLGLYMPLSSTDGSTITFVSLDALKGAEPSSNGAFNFYRSHRTALGWQTEQLGSQIGPAPSLNSLEVKGFTDDLSTYLQVGPPSPGPAPGGSEYVFNGYVRDAAGYHLISPGMPEHTEFGIEPGGFADDFSHVVFTAPEALKEEPPLTPPGVAPILYDWDAETGATLPVGWLPNGSIAPGPVTIASPPELNGSSTDHWNPVSSDGRRIFFYTPPEGPTRQLYVRIDGAATKQVSASKRTTVDPLAPKEVNFRIASTNGRVVFFSTAEKLTDDATTGPTDAGQDLYRYEVGLGRLTDITVDGTDADGAQVLGVLGAADNGSRVYFVAKGVLDAGATAGAENLYVWHDDGSAAGEIKFIAKGVPKANWVSDGLAPVGEHVVGRVTPDGMHVLFESPENLTAYNSNGHWEAYLYDAATEELVCASCNPAGTPATADAIAAGAGDVPKLARTLLPDASRVFFSTKEALVPADINSALDAYEYDVGTGQVALISSGEGSEASPFSDASADGQNVFFVTRDHLVGIDRDEAYDVYDARVGGGFADQNPPAPPPPCEGDNCRAASGPTPTAESPGSSAPRRHGNHKPRRRHGHHGKHRKPHHGKKSNGNRRGHR